MRENTSIDDYAQAYGMTEIGPTGVFQPPEDQIPKQGLVGIPALDHRVRLIELDVDPDR